MSSILLLVACLLLGWIVARAANPPAHLAQSLNWWVINVAFTALVLQLIPTLQLDPQLWFLIAAMWFVFLGAWLCFTLVGRVLNWSRARVGALTLVCGFGNVGLIGFPIVEALRGEDGLKLALVGDQAGCFIAFALGGTLIAALYSGANVQVGAVAKKVLLFPPFVAFLIGILAGLVGGWPDAIEPIFARLGATLAPIALFSVGLQLRPDFGGGQLSAVIVGLGWKIVLAPLIVYLVGHGIGVGGLVLTVAVLQSGMAPMISAAILAQQSNLEPQLASTLLGIGVVVAFITVPIINALI